MLTWFARFKEMFLHDEVAFRRWTRALIMGLAGSGMTFSDQLAEILGAPVKSIKVAAVVCMFISVMINLGDKNPPQGETK